MADKTAINATVDVNALHVWQKAIQTDKLRPLGNDYEPIKVAQIKGVLTVMDGNHRALSAFVNGDHTIRASVVNFDDKANLKYQTDKAATERSLSDHVHPINKKDDGFSRAFEVKKIDEDQQLVFGWASISSVDGEYVVDKQDDIIPEDELEKAAYDFVLYHRSQGDMHERMGVGRCVESMMFTKQKQDALGIDLGLVGWWIGFKVDDTDVWKRIKGGDLPEFSIGGKATREAA